MAPRSCAGMRNNLGIPTLELPRERLNTPVPGLCDRSFPPCNDASTHQRWWIRCLDESIGERRRTRFHQLRVSQTGVERVHARCCADCLGDIFPARAISWSVNPRHNSSADAVCIGTDSARAFRGATSLLNPDNRDNGNPLPCFLDEGSFGRIARRVYGAYFSCLFTLRADRHLAPVRTSTETESQLRGGAIVDLAGRSV